MKTKTFNQVLFDQSNQASSKTGFRSISMTITAISLELFRLRFLITISVSYSVFKSLWQILDNYIQISLT